MDKEQFHKVAAYAESIGIDKYAFCVALFIGVDKCHKDDMVAAYGTLATEKLLEWRKTEAFA